MKGYAGRVMRDVERRLVDRSADGMRAPIMEKLALVALVLRQTPRSRGKLYALHEPQVDCISKSFPLRLDARGKRASATRSASRSLSRSCNSQVAACTINRASKW